jgi:ABC-type multidrug transport system, permease component
MEITLLMAFRLRLKKVRYLVSLVQMVQEKLLHWKCWRRSDQLIAGWSKNEDQSSVLSNLISFPMMFLPGTFIPLYLFPEWLRSVVKFVPITLITDSFRLIMTEHATFVEVLSQFGIIAAWTFVIYLVAIKLFRWE